MKRIIFFIVPLFWISLLLNPCSTQDDFPALKGPYLGQKPPGMTPQLFAQEIISTDMDLHSCPVFSKDGKFAFWRIMNLGDDNGIYFVELKENKWSKPRKAPFIETGTDVNNDVPIFSPDNQTLFFLSNRSDKNKLRKMRIWYTKMKYGNWEKPKLFQHFDQGDISLHWQFSFAINGNIYFTGLTRDGLGEYDLFMAQRENEKYIFKMLPTPINSEYSDICPFIAPDENYIIFSSDNRQDGYGKQDLYICYKNRENSWTTPINMGAEINSIEQDWCPMVSQDGKYLFFTSFRKGNCNAYWVDAKVIETMRPKDLKYVAPKGGKKGET